MKSDSGIQSDVWSSGAQDVLAAICTRQGPAVKQKLGMAHCPNGSRASGCTPVPVERTGRTRPVLGGGV